MLKSILTSKVSSDKADRKFGAVFYCVTGPLVVILAVHKMAELGMLQDQLLIGIVLTHLVFISMLMCGAAMMNDTKSFTWLRRMLTARWIAPQANRNLRQMVFFIACPLALVVTVRVVDALHLSEAQAFLALLAGIAVSMLMLACGLVVAPAMTAPPESPAVRG